MTFFRESFFAPIKLFRTSNFLYSFLAWKQRRWGSVFSVYIPVLSAPIYVSSTQGKQPVIIPDQGIACQISCLFSQFLLVSLTLQWGMLWYHFSGMKDVCVWLTPSMASAELQLLSPVLCKCNRVEHRNSNGYFKCRDFSFQTRSFKDLMKSNSPEVVKDLKGSKRSVFRRWNR